MKQVVKELENHPERDPVHRRDPHGDRRRRDQRRGDGRLQPAEAGAGLGHPALHGLDHLQGIPPALREGPRPGPPLPEDRRQRADDRGHDQDPQGPEDLLRGRSTSSATPTTPSRRRSSCRPRYITDRKLPDKAIDVIDEAGAVADAAAREPSGKKIIGLKEVEAVVAKIARIPPKSVSKSDTEALRELEADLKRVVFGQDEAIDQLSAAMKMARAGLRDPNKPIGCYLFSGPTGVGKTEVGPAAGLHPGHRAAALRHVGIHGAPHGQPPDRRASGLCRLRPGRPADRRRRPAPALRWCCWTRSRRPTRTSTTSCCRSWTTASLTDANGKKVDFRNVVLIMTTNAGAADAQRNSIGFGRGKSRGRGRRGHQAPVHAGIPQPPGRHRGLQAADAGDHPPGGAEVRHAAGSPAGRPPRHHRD